MRYHFLDKNHAFTRSQDPPEELSGRMKRFWKKHSLGACHGAVIAVEHGRIVGFFRFDLERGKTMYAAGTFVLPGYRHRKIAKKLWKRALQHVKPTSVEVFITSIHGARLVSSLIRKGTKWRLSPRSRRLYHALRPLVNKYPDVGISIAYID